MTGPAGDPEISVEVCSLGSVSGPWSYSPADLTVRFSLSEEPRQLCVQMRGLGGLLTLAQCDLVTRQTPNMILTHFLGGSKTEMALEGI